MKIKRIICALTAIILWASSVSAFGESIREQTVEGRLIEDMILY